MDVTKILDWLKSSTTHLFWLLIFSSVVLSLLSFAPDNILAALGLRDFRTDYRTWIGLTWILSFSGLVVTVSKSVSQWAKSEITWRQNLKRGQERLHNLTPHERAVLRPYIEKNTRTRTLGIDDGVVQGLVAEEILYRPSHVSRHNVSFDHNMQPWAWAYINRHPGLVEGTEEGRDG